MTQQANPLHEYATHRDTEAFSQIVDQYQRLIFATCRRTLHNPGDVEDAVQETFLRLAQKAGELHSNLGGWLHRCAINVSIDINRRRSSQRRHEAAARRADVFDDPQQTLTELREQIDTAMLKLSDEDRELIIQRYFTGRKQNDLAAAAGVSASTITHRLDHAIESLRHHLKGLGCGVLTAGTAAVVTGALTTEHASAAVPTSLTANIMKIGLSGATASPPVAVPASLTLKGLAAAAAAIVIGAGAWFSWSRLQSSHAPAPLPVVPAAIVAASQPAPPPLPMPVAGAHRVMLHLQDPKTNNPMAGTGRSPDRQQNQNRPRCGRWFISSRSPRQIHHGPRHLPRPRPRPHHDRF